MSKRPPTDYISALIDDKSNQIKVAEKNLLNNVDTEAAERQLTESSKSLAMAVNALVGRTALTERDIEAIITQAKKASGLL